MHIHILGICGTFMGGIALLARAAGHSVSGQDAGVYPPMSEQLAAEGIALTEGYDPAGIPAHTDMVVIGNALSRGNPAVEYVLNRNLPYTSGPQWLAEHVLHEKWVLAVAGTHGKTTTASMLAWILEYANMAPGFLIGGVPQNFGMSARSGDTPFFVVEADEYDTAFFDKRSKFVHYRPRTAILNNLEYDHADIFPDLAAIERQFHHLVRTVPGQGLILAPAVDENIARVLRMGCWTPVEHFAGSEMWQPEATRRAGAMDGAGQTFGAGNGWRAREVAADGSRFEVWFGDELQGVVEWPLLGLHNVNNALAAIGAARHAGVPAAQACAALGQFKSVKRRLEVRGSVRDITVYDDFAHHPTAIATTVAGLRRRVGSARILALLEPRSNTMRLGVHASTLAPSLAEADVVMFYNPPDLGWDLAAAASALGERGMVYADVEAIVQAVRALAQPGDHVLVMSNGGFGGIHRRLLEALNQ